MDASPHPNPSAPEGIPLPLPFAGRSAELGRLARLWEDLRRGQGGALVIEGEPGVGKSRLVEEFLAATPTEGRIVLRGRGYEKELVPTRIVAEVVRDLLACARQARWKPAALLDPPMVRDLLPLVPEIAAALPFDTSLLREAPLPPHHERQRFHDSILRLLRNTSGRAPAVLLLEDLHWLGEEALDLLRYCAFHLRSSPILLLLTTRPVPARSPVGTFLRDLSEARAADFLPLRRLSAGETCALLGAALGEKPARELLPWIQARTAGNPLFITELLRALYDEGRLRFDPAGGRWALQGKPTATPLPRTIRSLVEKRLEGLSPPARRALEAAAALGEELAHDALLALIAARGGTGQRGTGLGGSEEEGIEALRQEGLLLPSGENLRFAHSLFREIVYQTLSPGERERLHAHAADLLENVVREAPERAQEIAPSLALHLSCSGEARRRRRAVDLFLLAGQQALARRAIPTAAASLEEGWALARALGLDRQRPGLARGFLHDLAQAAESMGKLDEAIAYCRQWSALGARRRGGRPSRSDAARMEKRLGIAHQKRGDFALARRHLTRGLQELRGASGREATLLRAELNTQLGFVDYREGNYEEAERWTRQAIETLSGVHAPAQLSDAQNNRGLVLWKRGAYGEAIAAFEECLEINREIGDPYRVSVSLNNLGLVHWNRGDLERAARLHEESLALRRTIGDLYGEAVSLNNLGVLSEDRAEWDRALALYEEGLLLRERCRDLQGIAVSRANIGEALKGMGRWEEAEANLGEGLALCERTRSRGFTPAILTALGEVSSARGREAEARDLFQRALRVARDLGSQIDEGKALVALGRSLIRRREGTRGCRAMTRGVALLRSLGSRVELARAREEEGIALLEEARCKGKGGGPARERALEALREALEIYRALGLSPRESLARERLAAMRQEDVLAELFATGPEQTAHAGAAAAHVAARGAPSTPTLSALEGAPPARALRILCFGRLRVLRPGEPEEIPFRNWGSQKARLILAYLATVPPLEQGATREVLADLFWPEADPKTIDNTFHVTLSHLRRALAPAERSRERYVVFRDGAYRIDWERGVWCDVRAFRSLLTSGDEAERAGDRLGAAARYARALDLYRGHYLDDVYERWSETQRDRFREEVRATVLKLAGWAIEEGRWEEAIQEGRRLLLLDPTEEEAHRLLMRAFAALGNRSAALRQYHLCADALRHELDLTPNEETEELLREIKTGTLREPPALAGPRLWTPR